MSASEKAIPLSEENPEWLANHSEIICNCGYKGEMNTLLCEENNDTLYCPQCRTSTWFWA